MLPNLKELQTFCAVVETGGINAAARRLNLARSVISKRMSDLEASVGSALIHRSTSRSTLTAAGEGFYERAVLVLSELEDAVNTTRGSGDGLTGFLRITIPVDAAASFLNQPLLDFAAQNPKLSMFVDLQDHTVNLAASGYDMAVRIGRLPDSNLRARRLFESARVVCAAPNYLAAHGMPQALDDLKSHDIIGYGNADSECFWSFSKAEEDATLSLRVTPRITFNNGSAMCAAAVAGLGITVLPEFIVADKLKAGDLQAIDVGATPLSDTVQAVYQGGRSAPIKVRSLIDFLAKRFR